MSPVTREDWVDATLGLLDSGRLPPEVPLAEMCQLLGVGEESFYTHFGDVGELRAAAAAQWRADRIAALPGPPAGAVRDPVDRIRMIQAALAGTAVRDAAMRRWAAADPAAAAEAAEADRVLASYLVAALTDLGLAGREPEAVAGVLAAALRTEQGNFEVVLGVLARAAVAPPGAPDVEGVAGAEPGQTVQFVAPPGGWTAAQREALTRIARLFAAGRGTEEPLPGPGREEAGEG